MANDPAGGSGDLPPSAKLIERLESKIASLDEKVEKLVAAGAGNDAKVAELEKQLAEAKTALDDAKAKRKPRAAGKPKDDDEGEVDDDVTEGLY